MDGVTHIMDMEIIILIIITITIIIIATLIIEEEVILEFTQGILEVDHHLVFQIEEGLILALK